MNRGWISRSALLALLLMLGLVLMAGCGGKKAEVETDPTEVDATETAEEVPPPPVAEEVEEVVDEGPDYANMMPADFGVGDVFFAFDQYDLDDEALGILSRNARILKEAGVPILISGHTDERGTTEHNLALANRRANAVVDYLTRLGVPQERLHVVPHGEEDPIAGGANQVAYAKNRRVDFRVMKGSIQLVLEEGTLVNDEGDVIVEPDEAGEEVAEEEAVEE
jgi:peptidoglycan-associated lipoprotein